MRRERKENQKKILFIDASEMGYLEDRVHRKFTEDDINSIKDVYHKWRKSDEACVASNFGWMQHMLYHLAPHGVMATVLANGSLSSNTSGEGEIRKRLIENDLVECIVALPKQLFIIQVFQLVFGY